MKNLVTPENAAEASALQAILKRHGIHAAVISFHDTAYDGLFQTQYGWGVLRVDEKDFPQAQKIVREWKESAPEHFDWQEE